MSLGFSEVRLPPCNPSTTIRALLPPFIEFIPLTRIVAFAPGAPAVFNTNTPAARPCKAWSTRWVESWVRSAPFTELIAPVRSLFFWLPYPTTTTSPIKALICFKWNSNIVLTGIHSYIPFFHILPN